MKGKAILPWADFMAGRLFPPGCSELAFLTKEDVARGMPSGGIARPFDFLSFLEFGRERRGAFFPRE
jgi:hypothetical protein